MLSRNEEARLEDSVRRAAQLAVNGEVFAGAAVLHAAMQRVQAALRAGDPRAPERLRRYGEALRDYLDRHELYTYAGCRVNGHCSLDVAPTLPGPGEPARELVTIAFLRSVHVVPGYGDEALVYADSERGGYTLATALERGWACVLDAADRPE